MGSSASAAETRRTRNANVVGSHSRCGHLLLSNLSECQRTFENARKGLRLLTSQPLRAQRKHRYRNLLHATRSSNFRLGGTAEAVPLPRSAYRLATVGLLADLGAETAWILRWEPLALRAAPLPQDDNLNRIALSRPTLPQSARKGWGTLSSNVLPYYSTRRCRKSKSSRINGGGQERPPHTVTSRCRASKVRLSRSGRNHGRW